MMCYHVDGTCLHYKRGLFDVVIMESMEFFNDIDRIRDLKIGIEKIMSTYYDWYKSNVNATSVSSQVKEDKENSPAYDFNEMSSSHSKNGTKASSSNHDFVVRMLDLKAVYLTKTSQGTQASCIVMDGRTVINATDVMSVLRLVPDYMISDAIAAKYYTGELYVPPKTSSLPIHLPLIIGVTVGKYLGKNREGRKRKEENK